MGMQQKPLLTDENGALLSPDKPFDPKAFTRETWEKKEKIPKPEGPLVSFNVHPDAYVRPPLILGRHQILSPKTKAMIKWIRIIQLGLRVIQLVAAVGVLFLFIVLTKVPTIISWLLKITGGVASLHCSYSAYHHSRRAGGRSPASSAAYQLFSFLADAAIVGIYVYGFFTANRDSEKWSTFMNTSLMDSLRSTTKYGLIGSAGSHFVTLLSSGWLAFIFYQISKLPPDMNPLVPKLTSRGKRHKKSKSLMASNSSMESLRKDVFGHTEAHRLSIQTIDELNSPRQSIPFLETLSNSPSSPTGSRDSRMNLPSRQYQIMPSNRNSRGSIDYQGLPSGQPSPTKSRPPTSYYTPRDMPPTKSRPGTGHTVSYDYDLPHPPMKSRPTTGYSSPGKTRSSTGYYAPHNFSPRAIPNYDRPSTPTRTPKFVETWAPTDSLISRTQKRLNEDEMRVKRSYEALQQLCDGSDDDDEMMDSDEEDFNQYVNQIKAHPDPLRTHHPESPSGSPAGTPKKVSNHDMINQRPLPLPTLAPLMTGYRESFIQDESNFSIEPYGALGGGPVTIGGNRQVSPGNNFEMRGDGYGRRNVSGKMAEEGRAGYED